MLEQWDDAVFGHAFADAKKGDAAIPKPLGKMSEGVAAIAIAHLVKITTWGKVHTNALGAPSGHGCISSHKHQTDTVVNGAAIAVITQIGAALQKLIYDGKGSS
jgi:hypothetical protein